MTQLPHNPADGSPLQGVLYIREPGSDAFIAVPLEIERYTITQRTRIRRGAAESSDRMPIIVYGTALGIIHNPAFSPFESAMHPITEGNDHD